MALRKISLAIWLKCSRLVCGAAVVGAVSLPALAQQSDVDRLGACFERIESDPEGAYEDGLEWMAYGAPPAARQCTALALIGLGRFGEGAARLEKLANAPDGGALESRAIYLAQAGNAWLLEGAPEAALVALGNALKIAPGDASLYKDMARAQLLMEDWQAAGSELDKAIEMSPGDGEALRLRGYALMKMDRLSDAWDDVVASLEQDPDSIDTLVLRGDVREAMRRKGIPDPIDG